MCVGTSSSGRPCSCIGSTFSTFPFLSFRPSADMAAPSSSPGAFVDTVVADLVAPPPTTTSAPTAARVGASPTPGEIGENAGQPTSGALAGDFAGLPSVGAAALVEPAVGDEDVAPPVMGVPSSSDEDEELLADDAGAPMMGPPPAAIHVLNVGAQTEHLTPIPAFDSHDVAVQTEGVVFFSSMWATTPRRSWRRPSEPCRLVTGSASTGHFRRLKPSPWWTWRLWWAKAARGQPRRDDLLGSPPLAPTSSSSPPSFTRARRPAGAGRPTPGARR